MNGKNIQQMVSIIIPAYNEAGAIAGTIRELQEGGFSEAEIVVIDDGSSDGTYEQVKEIESENIKIVRHKVNRGYGSAIATGIRLATREIIAWYDADGQHRPEDLMNVVSTLVEQDLDYCVGVRGNDSFVDKSRVFGKKILKLIVNILSKEPMGDFNSGMRAFKRDIIFKYISILPKRFGASTVTTFLMQENRYKGGEVSIVVRQRIGKSTVNQLKDGIRTISLIINIIIMFRPMEIFGCIGLWTIILGSIYGVVKAIIEGTGVPTLAAIIIILGIQIFFFGILSAQISQLRNERFDEKN